MKCVIVIFVALAAVSCDDPRITETGYYQVNGDDSDGLKLEDQGGLQQVKGADERPLAYEFNDPTGQRYRVGYVADGKGYRPSIIFL